MSKIELFEICGTERDRVFSPYCWTIRYALNHKGLPHDTVPIRFTEKEKIEFSGQPLVPVLRADNTVIHESWRILEWLDANFDGPSLFPNGKATAHFIHHWMDNNVAPNLAPIFMLEIFRHLDPEDQAYFRKARENKFGMTLEAFSETANIDKARQSLAPLRAQLAMFKFIEGSEPTASDFIAIGRFLWARGVSDISLLEKDDPIYDWRNRVFALFDNLGFSTQGYDL